MRIPLLILATLAGLYKSLAFGLNAYSPEMCFVLKGNDVGKTLQLSYTVFTDKKLNMHFSIFDIEAREMIHQETSDDKFSADLSLDVNFLHNFRICWKNMDSEEKRVNFTYKHNIELPMDSKDVQNHMEMLSSFQQESERVRDTLYEEKNMQEHFYKRLVEHEGDIKKLFFFKTIVLLAIVLLQVYMLSKLIDSNVHEMKTIVIGPH